MANLNNLIVNGPTSLVGDVNIAGLDSSIDELNYVHGVTSNIQTQLNGKSATSHTHNYAGSSSAGGAATSANRLYAPTITTTFGTTYTIDTYLTLIKGTLPLGTQGYYTWKHSWSYAGNGLLSATIGSTTHKIQLAGAHCEFIGVDAGEYVLKITTATTSGTTGASFTTGATYQYNCHGASYTPTWTIDSAIVGLSVSGQTITYTKNNGTTGTITTQDTNTTYGAATTSANGLMTAAMVTKLNGIATGANAYSHPTTTGNKHIPSGGSSGQILRWSADGTATWGADNNTTYGVATTSANGLMSAADKGILDGLTSTYSGALNNLTTPGLHYCSNDSSTNYPVGTNGHVLVMTNTDKTRIRQIFMRSGTLNTNDWHWYSRQYINGTWGQWVILSGSNSAVYSGTLTSGTASCGSIYGTSGGWLIVAQLGANKRMMSCYITRSFLTTDSTKWCFQIADDGSYITFYFYYTDTTLYVKINTSSSTSNAIRYVFPIS